MTFTVAIRDPEAGEMGFATATCSIAFGGQGPFLTPAGDLVVSQAFACPADGWRMAEAMGRGSAPEAAFAALRETDPHLDHRQILALPVSGAPFAHTGASARPWRGHEIGPDFVVAGNVLAGPEVLAAMAASAREGGGLPMAERLMRALEAARSAGGQAAGGAALTERSAALRVTDAREMPGLPLLDLRVDMHPSALHEMRRLLAFHEVYARYAELRDRDAPNAPSMAEYEAEHARVTGAALERPSMFR